MKAKNPSGKTIEFDPANHSFKVSQTDQTLIGSTSVIKGFFNEFDADKWAPRTAKKRGITKAAILKEWAEKAERGRNEGTNVHEYAEYALSCRFWPDKVPPPRPEPLSDRCEVLFEITDRSIAWLSKYYQLEAIEKIIFSPHLGVAGIIDFLMINEDGLTIFDWKQNKIIKNSNPYQQALGPLKHLEDHDFNKYSLQLNIYRHILLEENYYPEGTKISMKLIHLTPEGYFPMRIYKMEEEVGEIFKQSNGLFPAFMV